MLPLSYYVSPTRSLQQDDLFFLGLVESLCTVSSPSGLNAHGCSMLAPTVLPPAVLNDESCNPHLQEFSPLQISSPVGLENDCCIAENKGVNQGSFGLLSILIATPTSLQRKQTAFLQHQIYSANKQALIPLTGNGCVRKEQNIKCLAST